VTKHIPLIGISGSIDKDETEHFIMRSYTSALLQAGAAPVLLSPDMEGETLQACLDRLDGVLLAGGNDVSPVMYGATPVQELGEVNPLRDRFEMRLVKEAIERRMPILGICRGIQSLNVALGGTLWQDLPSQFRTAEGGKPILHSQTSRACYNSHEVTIEEGTLLHKIAGDTVIWTNSFHHEAVEKPAPGLRITAHTADGVIEAVEHEELPYCIGVQWHPERSVADNEHARALFASFVEAASAYGYGE